MNPTFQRLLITVTASAVALGAYGASKTPVQTSGLPPDMGRDALRIIVQEQCVLNFTQHNDPAPCERVFLADPKVSTTSGYAVLADRKGGAHFLLIPTQTFTGLENSELLDPDAPNYFAEAWHARDLISKTVGHAVPRSAIGLAVNTAHARTQNQFHIHIECLRQDVADSLHAAADHVSETWSQINVAGSPFAALRISGDGLDGSNPYELLANYNSDARHRMGDYTLLVAGMQFKDGPGFIVLTATGPTGELLLDSTCAVAGGSD